MISPLMQESRVLDADGEECIGVGMDAVCAFKLIEKPLSRVCLALRPNEDEPFGQSAGAAGKCLAGLGQRPG